GILQPLALSNRLRITSTDPTLQAAGGWHCRRRNHRHSRGLSRCARVSMNRSGSKPFVYPLQPSDDGPIPAYNGAVRPVNLILNLGQGQGTDMIQAHIQSTPASIAQLRSPIRQATSDEALIERITVGDKLAMQALFA